jgi:type I restriction enzyme S subunit
MKYEALESVVSKAISGEWGDEGNRIKVIRTTNFTNDGRLDLKRVVERNISETKIEKKHLIPGDIILEKSGGGPKQPVGRVVFFEEEGEYVTNNFTATLRPDESKVYPKYLLYVLFAGYNYGNTLKFQNKTTGIINLQTTRFLKKTQIPLPPLPTQTRIARALDLADRHRRLLREELDAYDRLGESLFLEMFGDPVRNEMGWDVKKLKDLIDIKHGYAFKSEFFDYEGEFILLTPGNFLEQGGFRDQGIKQKFYTTSDFPKNYILKQNDLLIAMTEQAAGLLGSPLFVPEDSVYLHNQRLGLVQIKKPIELQFLFSFLNFKSTRRRIHHSATGTKVRHTSPTKLLDLKIYVPPLPLQTEFATRITQINLLKAKTQTTLKEADDLFNVLLQRAFRGELFPEATAAG